MRRGEIWWAAPPLPAATRKRRPLVIVSDDAFNLNERYPKIMVVHLTSVRRVGRSYGWEVDLPRGVAGLPQPSVAKCGEIYTVLKEQLREFIGTLPAEHVARIDGALCAALGIRPPSAGSSSAPASRR